MCSARLHQYPPASETSWATFWAAVLEGNNVGALKVDKRGKDFSY